ncbi:MAG: hypothetical protein Q9186_005997 [Xanthomendoza sp. 1 TL-2023]
MSTAVLYFLPTTSADISPLSDLINRLTSRYNPSILPRWSLRQRLFRSTPSPSPNDENLAVAPARYLQVLSLADYPYDSHIAITPITAAAATNGTTAADPVPTVISIPAGPSTDDFTQLLVSRLGPLWQQRQVLAVIDGLAFEIGDFRVRAGELRQGVGGAQLVRGVVVEVAYTGQGGGGQDRSQTEEIITVFWDELGVNGAKGFRGGKKGEEEDGFESVRLWCRVLMLKS